MDTNTVTVQQISQPCSVQLTIWTSTVSCPSVAILLIDLVQQPIQNNDHSVNWQKYNNQPSEWPASACYTRNIALNNAEVKFTQKKHHSRTVHKCIPEKHTTEYCLNPFEHSVVNNIQFRLHNNIENFSTKFSLRWP